MTDLRLDGNDRIVIFTFPTRSVTEADILEGSVGQAFIALRHLLSGFCLEQYRGTCASLTADECGGIRWAEAARFLLCSYATSMAIREALVELREVSLKTNEKETKYSSRWHRASIDCAVLHSANDPTIKSLVSRQRENHARMLVSNFSRA